MADKFLHDIDVNSLKNELKMDVPDIAKLAEISENGVYKWSWDKSKNGTRPSYNAIVRLLQAGATTKTLFGVDYAATHQPAPEPVSAAPSPEFLKAHPELLEGMREQLLEMGFVSKDQIEDLIRQTIERKSGGKV